MAFHPEKFDRFRLTGFDADAGDTRTGGRTASAVLRYALDDEHHFEERVDFGRSAALSEGRAVGFEKVVRLLHLAGGVSYYKVAAPKRIEVETGLLTTRELQFCRDLYDLGLREFAYRNGLEVPRDLDVVARPAGPRPRGAGAPSRAAEGPVPGVAVPIGGGKDSIVALEALRELDPVLVSVNPNAASRRIARVAGLDLVEITRRLDPLLFDLNANGALNGHIPVTAIVSLITVAAGYLAGYDTTVVALESSADSPTRVVAGSDGEGAGAGTEVNHQWSKSAAFERQLQGVLRESVHPSIRYLSPLRKFDEVEITAAFATLERYLSAFRSCNRVARIADPSDAWCGDCPKCRFVYLALATALERPKVTAIFGVDLLDDATQTEGFRDMLDPTSKPFECVGTVEEVERAFRELLDDPAWSHTAVVQRVRPLVEARPAAEARGAASAEVFDTVRRVVAGASSR